MILKINDTIGSRNLNKKSFKIKFLHLEFKINSFTNKIICDFKYFEPMLSLVDPNSCGNNIVQKICG